MGRLRLAFHTASFMWFASVWGWHFSPEASKLPGAQGFGWFFKFLTFYTYTLQTLLLGLCVLEGFIRKRGQPRTALSPLVDDLGCALFGCAHVVTIMFHVIQASTRDVVEEGAIQRPPWLDVSVHKLNTVVVWLDLLLAPPKAFSKRAERLSVALVLVYTAWILTCRFFNGRFPYPFMNKMPMPAGFVWIVCASCVVFLAMFRLGKAINEQLSQLRRSLAHDPATCASYSASAASYSSAAGARAGAGGEEGAEGNEDQQIYRTAAALAKGKLL